MVDTVKGYKDPKGRQLSTYYFHEFAKYHGGFRLSNNRSKLDFLLHK